MKIQKILMALRNCTANGTACLNVTDTDLETGEKNINHKIVFAIIEGVLMVIIVFGNGLVIGAFYRSEKLKTLTNFFIMNLAIADLCVGLIMPLHIAMFLKPGILENIYVCLFRYVSLNTMLGASTFCLVAITVERYVIIAHGMRYRSVITRTRSLLAILIVWLLPAVLYCLIPMVWHDGWEGSNRGKRECDVVQVLKFEWLTYFALPIFIIQTIIILALYTKIFHIARKHAHKISETQTTISKENLLLNQSLRMTKTAAIILGTFFVCWAPAFVILGVQVFSKQFDSASLNKVRVYVTLLAVLNSGLNPLIYAFRMKDFRREFKQMLHIRNTSYIFSRKVKTKNRTDNDARIVTISKRIKDEQLCLNYI